MKPLKFDITLTFETDWHVGLGAGRPGSLDRLVTRDADDLPYVPAKTLRGIWRDACERLAFALDGGSDEGAWSRRVAATFGDQPAQRRDRADDEKEASAELSGLPDDRPRLHPGDGKPCPSALTIRPARLPKELRERLRGDAMRPLREALAFAKPGVKIDHRSGRAEDEHLRFIEMARTGAILEARGEIDLDQLSELEWPAIKALLVAGAGLVDRLGGHRRRGSGRCTMKLAGLGELDEAIHWIESPSERAIEDVDPPSPEATESDGEAGLGQETDALTFVRANLVIVLDEPLAVTHRTVGNVVESLDFLPGTYLLPHVTRSLEGLFDVRSAVARGDLRVSPATVEVDGVAGLPVPMALFQRKNGGGFRHKGTIVNRFVEEDESGTPLKGLRAGYVADAGTGALLPRHVTPEKKTRTHNTVEDRAQRPTTEVGGVYTYEAIAAGTRLRCEVAVRKSLVAKAPVWSDRLNGEVSIGRSKKDDYGQATIQVAWVADDRIEGPESQPAFTGDRLVVWLTSDLLIRDERLRFDPSPERLRAVLAGRLGLGDKLVFDAGKEREKFLHAAIRTRRIESWQVSWGMPRPSLVAMSAGSCVAFRVAGEGGITPEFSKDISEIEAEGLGERLGEGYGRVRFNAPLLMASLKEWEVADDLKGEPDGAANDPPGLMTDDFAEVVEREAWRDKIRRESLALAYDQERRTGVLHLFLSDRGDSRPTLTQLGGLRMRLQRLRKPGDAERIAKWVKDAKGWAGEHENKAREAVIGLLDDKAPKVWEHLKPDGSPDQAPWPRLTKQEIKTKLWAEAVRTLIDACIRAHKRESESRTLTPQ